MAGQSLQEIGARLARESAAAYRASPHAFPTTDFFRRYHRDARARPGPAETEISAAWQILLGEDASPLAGRMAGHLAEFLRTGMGLDLRVERRPGAVLEAAAREGGCAAGAASPRARAGSPGGAAPGAGAPAVCLLERGGGDPEVPESFTLGVSADGIVIRGRDAAGLRDGVAHLGRTLGLRRAPFLPHGEQVHSPRLPVRLDFYYGSDHTFPHLGEMLAAKIALLQRELDEVLPALALQLGL
ncbi:MAG: hypothetical protein AB1505_29530 [Candidatus Latescibacterota bacterium]